MVPRLRTWASPIRPAASARPGACRRTTSETATSACRVSAPMISRSPSVRMPLMLGRRPMSIRYLGSCRRSFMAGTRLWPPASSLASSPYWLKRLIASWREPGARYSKLAGYIGAPHLLGGVLDGLDDVDVAGAAAQVALDAALDLVFGGIGVGLQQVDGLHDHARRAEAALQAVLLPEALLHRVQPARRRQALDGQDVRALGLNGEDGARLHRPAIHVDGAGAALGGVTADMRAG